MSFARSATSTQHRVFEAAHDAFEVRDAGGQRGLGVFARTALPAGTVLFKEYPVVGMQHLNNRATGVTVCERCFRFLGPIEDQIGRILVGADRSCTSIPAALPSMPSSAAMPAPVRCPGGCSLLFCSTECASANFAEQHRLLCRGCTPTGAGSSGASSSGAASSSAGLEDMMVDMAISPATEAIAKFEAHAGKSNEVFLLAAKAMALVFSSIEAGVPPEEALEPFPGPLWWDAIATPDDVTDEASFRATLRQVGGRAFEQPPWSARGACEPGPAASVRRV